MWVRDQAFTFCQVSRTIDALTRASRIPDATSRVTPTSLTR